MLTSNEWGVCPSQAHAKNHTRNSTVKKIPSTVAQEPFSRLISVARIFCLLWLGALCLNLAGCSSDDSKQQAQAAAPLAVSVAVAPVHRQNLPLYLTGLR